MIPPTSVRKVVYGRRRGLAERHGLARRFSSSFPASDPFEVLVSQLDDELRHTRATQLIDVRVDFKTVQTSLGYADVPLTINTYTHPCTRTS